MKNFRIQTVILIITILMGCEEFKHEPVYDSSNETVQEVEIINVERLPGGAEITFSTPKGSSFLYVQANVVNKSGNKLEFISSFYSNSLIIRGLGDTSEYDVEIYSVGKSKKQSESQNLRIKPLEPAYLKAFKTLAVQPDFSGVNVQLQNIDSEDLGVFLMSYDSLGIFDVVDNYFSNNRELNQTFRGFPNEESQFGVYIEDNWGNSSDTLIVSLTPLYEKMIDKEKFKEVVLPGDVALDFGKEYLLTQNAYHHLWDGVWSTDFDNPYTGNGVQYKRIKTDAPNTGIESSWITIDIGEKVYLSRFRVNGYWRYESNAPKRYEIWGIGETPPSDGSWDGWTKIASFEQVKPSGLPPGQFTNDDAIAWERGDEGAILPGSPAVRYIRFRVLENWAGNTNFELEEITFWGAEE